MRISDWSSDVCSSDLSICSTRPVQEPQELAALVCFLISSTVNRPCSRIAFTMVPLHTPLQPQISVESGMPAPLFSPEWPVSPMELSPNISCSRSSATDLAPRLYRKGGGRGKGG